MKPNEFLIYLLSKKLKTSSS